MKRLHVIGRKNHGKTTLVVELVERLTRRGLKVGTIKHTPHDHELDTPGKDSHRHRQAGGTPATVTTPGLLAVFIPRDSEQDCYATLAPLYSRCDLLIVEDDADAKAPKIEVWRAGVGGAPMASERSDIMAVVTDDRLKIDVPVWPRNDMEALADRVVATLCRAK